MKRQLRPGDTLARLGGDEFAVLVSEVRNRAEVEEIAAAAGMLLRRAIHGRGICGARFGQHRHRPLSRRRHNQGWPLSSADNAMYTAKYTRMEKNRAPQAHQEDQFAPKKQARKRPGLRRAHQSLTSGNVLIP